VPLINELATDQESKESGVRLDKLNGAVDNCHIIKVVTETSNGASADRAFQPQTESRNRQDTAKFTPEPIAEQE
jgi:hypothetical protein